MLVGYWYVYRITHIASGRHYVGLTNDFERRKHEHLKLARNDSSQYIHRAIRRYGPDAFEWVSVARCSTLELASQAEQIIIKQLNAYGAGFNMTTGGEARWTKVTRPETKKKLAALYLGKSYEELHGPKVAADIKRRQSAAHLGKRLSDATRSRMSASNRIRWATVRNLGKKGRPCRVRGVQYKNVTTAAKANGVTKGSVFYWIRKGQHGAAFL